MPVDPMSPRKSTENCSSKQRSCEIYAAYVLVLLPSAVPLLSVTCTITDKLHKDTCETEMQCIWQCVCILVSMCVWSVALTQVCACRVHMLFHLSHSERLLHDELLISQNRTHKATHIIIGEAAVDGVIYCRVISACVGRKGCIWIDLLHVSIQCMATLLVYFFILSCFL